MHAVRSLRSFVSSVGSTAIVAFTAAALIVGLGVWQIKRTRDALLLDAEQDARNLARALAQHATKTVESVDVVLSSMVDEAERHATPKDIDSDLRRRGGMLGQVRNFVVMDAAGHWLADTAPPHAAVTSADRSYFLWHRDHADADLHVDSTIVGVLSGKPGIPLSRRIEDDTGAFAGVALATLRPDYFESFYETVRIGAKGTGAVAGVVGI